MATTELKDELINKIRSREANIAVMGLGYVGLPTSIVFAGLGFKVTGIDINPNIITQINNDKLETKEHGLKDQVKNARSKGFLSATSKPFEALNEADIIIVSVQTPVNKEGNANLSFLKGACEEISLALRRKNLVVIQSTVPPKTLVDIVVPILEEKSHLCCGKDFWLIYCPERMAPGTGLHDLSANARLIGAYNLDSAVIGRELFQLVTNGGLLITDFQSAEVSKLAENVYRFVNIAFANELALICRQIGVDVQEVIRLANTHPRVNIHQPGCGAGGPCLSKDTNLLLESIQSSGFKCDVIPAALRLNSAMAHHIVSFMDSRLKNLGKNLELTQVCVFGTAYKGNVDDSRDSPSEGIIRELQKRKARVIVYDPICQESFGAHKAKDLFEAVNGTDCIIIATDHKIFSELNLVEIKTLMNKNPLIVDGKRIINPTTANKNGFEYVAVSSVSKNIFQ